MISYQHSSEMGQVNKYRQVPASIMTGVGKLQSFKQIKNAWVSQDIVWYDRFT